MEGALLLLIAVVIVFWPRKTEPDRRRRSISKASYDERRRNFRALCGIGQSKNEADCDCFAVGPHNCLVHGDVNHRGL